ncbi:hypothetical protein [Streptomyces olivaceoviridis]|uniref:hypothetical protein n=1 Tax=Streptomyces olivaceoviridis TaxID=1921 RepID=UPI00367A165D
MNKRIRQLIAGLALTAAAATGTVLAAAPGDTHWGAEDTHWGIVVNGSADTGAATVTVTDSESITVPLLDTHWG